MTRPARRYVAALAVAAALVWLALALILPAVERLSQIPGPGSGEVVP